MSDVSDARERAEAEIWRQYPKSTPEQVDAVLAAMDFHADAAVAAALHDRARKWRLRAAEASAAEHRARLEQGLDEHAGKAS